MTPLHKAIEAGNSQLVRMLLDAGADTSLRARLYGDLTATELATYFGEESVQTMLEA
jgi:ankyrin repeat protein